MGRIFSNFGLIGCKSSKKCAKFPILSLTVKIRKYECHQNISWVWFAEDDISNYGLILNTADSSEKLKVLIKIIV
jgi:hypothetical protein